MEPIYKPGTCVRNLIEHHTKYIETHGLDETVWMTISDHHKIDHRKLFPMVTRKELATISARAYKRTQKAIDDINNEKYRLQHRSPNDVEQMRKDLNSGLVVV